MQNTPILAPKSIRRRPSRFTWTMRVIGGYILLLAWNLFPRFFRLRLYPLFIILSLLKH